MPLRTEELAELLSGAEVVILVTDADPEGLILHPSRRTVTANEGDGDGLLRC